MADHVNEEKMIDIWKAIFECDDIYGESDFFELGGNSMHAVQLIGLLEQDYGVALPFTAILDESSPRKLTRLMLSEL